MDTERAIQRIKNLRRGFLGLGGLLVVTIMPDRWHIGVALILYAILVELYSLVDKTS